MYVLYLIYPPVHWLHSQTVISGTNLLVLITHKMGIFDAP